MPFLNANENRFEARPDLIIISILTGMREVRLTDSRHLQPLPMIGDNQQLVTNELVEFEK